MNNRRALRLDYLRNVSEAFHEYLELGHELHIRSDHVGAALEVTFVIEDPDAYHALLEAKPHPTGPSHTP